MKEINKDLFDRDFEEYIRNCCYVGKKILDVGCGEGYKSLYFDASKNNICGLDIMDRRLEEVKSKLEFFLNTESKMPFEDSFFDVISNFDVLEHVEDDKNIVKEMYRVLSSGGTLITFTPNLNRMSNKVIELFTHKKLHFPRCLGSDEYLADCLHLREYTKRSLTTLFENIGFSKVEVQNYWLGFRFPVVESFRIKTKIPSFLKDYSQYLIAVCKK